MTRCKTIPNVEAPLNSRLTHKMMTLPDCIAFAESSAEAAFDCWRDDYATLADAIASHADNVRDTLNDEHAAHFEYEAFAAFDARVALLHAHAAEDALIAERRALLDYGVTVIDRSGRVFTLCINGASVFELTRSGYSVADARAAAFADALQRAEFDGEIGAGARIADPLAIAAGVEFKARWSKARCKKKGYTDWREALCAAWHQGWDANEPDGHLLRQLRNTCGFEWLRGAK